MADLTACPKKRPLSKKERKIMMSEKGKKSTKIQGIGVRSRQDFTLPSLRRSEIDNGKRVKLLITIHLEKQNIEHRQM